ncbi:MAG: FHA domain-containing protein [Gammaproteobacteria bacterium]
MLAIEINDAGIVVADRDEVLAIEPGYALAENGRIATGADAERQARLKPRHVSNRYWASLSLEPGSAGIGELSAAELAYRQLDALWSRFRGSASSAVLVVPGSYTREQLGLLLGVADECGIDVAALVDAAVAAASRPYPGRRVVHVDAGLHRVSVTPVEQGDEAIAGSELALESTGLAAVRDMVARWIAETFVLATRFDPFHHASSEQALYDRLPRWLGSLDEADAIELTLEHGEDTFAVKVERERLVGVVRGFNRAVTQLIAQARTSDEPLVVQVSERLARLPGLARELARLDAARIVNLPVGHAAREAIKGIERVERNGGPVRLLKHLPWRAPAEDEPEAVVRAQPNGEPAPAADAPVRDVAATHVVYRGVAYPVGADGIVIGRAAIDGRRTIIVDGAQGGVSRLHCELAVRDGELRIKDLSRYGTFVNEKPVSGDAVLQPGDVIRVGSPGVELLVIGVAGDGA